MKPKNFFYSKLLAKLALLIIGLTNIAASQTQPIEVNKASNEVKLNEIKVIAVDQQKTAIQTPGAVSSRNDEQKQQPIDDVLRGIPGTFTQIDTSQGAITTNIRGLSGMGRVNTMVDGISQTYFGTSAGSHHGSVGQSQFATVLDPNFIVSTDVSRGFSSGSANVNNLAGSVNFKTIDVEDLLQPNKDYGFKTRFSYGTNDIGSSEMLAAAIKKSAFNNEGSIGALIAISGKQTKGTFETAEGNGFDEIFDVFSQEAKEYYQQKPISTLAKLNIRLNEFHNLKLQHRYFKNFIGRKNLTSHNYLANYEYTPYSELINLKTLFGYTNEQQEFIPNAGIGSMREAFTKNTSFSGDIKNTSIFEFNKINAEITAGAKYQQSEYSRRVVSNVTDPTNAESNEKHTPFGIPGKQQITSLYLDGLFTKDIYTLSAGLNYNKYKLSGHLPQCSSAAYGVLILDCEFQEQEYNITNTNSGLSFNTMFYAELKDWFQPFISYSITNRGPNPQELFFNNELAESMNPRLKSEKSNTIQVGFNSDLYNLFTDNDNLSFKALAFSSKVKDYIFSNSMSLCVNPDNSAYLCSNEQRLEHINHYKDHPAFQGANKHNSFKGDFNAYKAFNSIKPVYISGAELEAMYENTYITTKLSYSYERTTQPISVQTLTVGNFSFGDISELPRWYANLDIGTKWLDGKLMLGAIIKGSGKGITNELLSIDEEVDLDSSIRPKPTYKIPTIIDLYAVYRPTKNITLSAGILNATNRPYKDALNKMNYIPAKSDTDIKNVARGRTFAVALEARF